MLDFLKSCFTKTVLLRSLYISLIVGTLLFLVNYGNPFIEGNFNREMVFPAFLNYLIPFAVSKVVSGLQKRELN